MGSLLTGAEAVVFDCDGLLVNTEACWTVAETAIFAAHGHPFGPKRKALVIGRTVEDAGEAMAQCLGRPGAGAELAAELLERVRKELSRGAAALPGAAELVRACRALRRGRTVPFRSRPRPRLAGHQPGRPRTAGLGRTTG